MLEAVLYHGFDEKKQDAECRTGTFTRKMFGASFAFDLQAGFPAQTTKKLFLRGIIREFIWVFARHDTNIMYLIKNGIHYWSEWPYQKYVEQTQDDCGIPEFERKLIEGEISPGFAELGKVYGHYAKAYPTLVEQIKKSPLGRRHILSFWDDDHLTGEGALLPPCHGNHIQFDVSGEFLDVMMVQRSCDLVLGLPFDIVLYGLLLHVTAKLCDLKPRYLNIVLGNTHIYENHYPAAAELLEREPLPLCNFEWKGESIEDMLDSALYEFTNYQHCGKLKSSTEVAI